MQNDEMSSNIYMLILSVFENFEISPKNMSNVFMRGGEIVLTSIVFWVYYLTIASYMSVLGIFTY